MSEHDDTEMEMEKYAVEEDNDSVKTAQDAAGTEPLICPNCGATLEVLSKVNVLKCPECGTKPFEGGTPSNA